MGSLLTTLRSFPRQEDSCLPLAPFLTSLESDGIRPSLHDYQRIHLALRSRGRWTLERLRGVLAALLVRDPEQDGVFRRRFEEFFGSVGSVGVPGVDLERALAELRSLEGVGESGLAPRHVEGGGRPQRPPQVADDWAFGRFVPAGLGLVAVGVLALGLGWWFSWVSPKPELTVPSSVDFEPLPGDITVERTMELQNIGVLPKDEPPKDYEHPKYEPPKDEHPKDEPPKDEPPEDVLLRDVLPKNVTTLATRAYQVPTVTDIRPIDVSYPRAWWRLVALVGALMLAELGIFVWGWWRRRPPRVAALEWDPQGPRYFRPGEVGGLPAPWLDRQTLDFLADQLGHFRSEVPGQRLDVPRSVEATVRRGGVPWLMFKRQHHRRRLVVLEDIEAVPRAWNPLAGELARGLMRRGVQVLHGFFRGVPSSFRTASGATLELDDLVDDAAGQVVLVFSDGKGLRQRRDALVLETLARLPQVAWMELRERRAWDTNTALPARYGLRVFPASPRSLLGVLGGIAGERGPSTKGDRGEVWRGGPVMMGREIDEAQMEHLLGDALPWAQGCAMVPPPLSKGLADTLRRRFYPFLPTERIGRLLSLPGVADTEGGLHFSDRLLVQLRRGFKVRQSEQARAELLEFLIGVLDNTEPEERKSLKHQVWEWRRERLHYEIDPDGALKRLVELAGGPLRDVVRGDFGKGRLEDLPGRGIPLQRPQTLRGLQQLHSLSAASGVEVSQAFPRAPWERSARWSLGIGIVVALGVVVFINTLFFYENDLVLTLEPDAPGILAALQISRNGEWHNVCSGLVDPPSLDGSLRLVSWPFDESGQYRLRLRGRRQEVSLEQVYDLGQLDGELSYSVEIRSREIKVSELLESAIAAQKPPSIQECETPVGLSDSGLQSGAPSEEPAIGMRLRYVPGGRFCMGSPKDEPGRERDEPLHEVEMTRGFWMFETEVTQGQWRRLMDNNPARFQDCGDDCPVERVSWYEVLAFANQLSERAGLPACYGLDNCRGTPGADYTCVGVSFAGLSCKGYRLPTEAEWERAARAGTDTAIYTGGPRSLEAFDSPELGKVAWYGGNSRGRTHPAGKKSANGWELHDMLGNVYEWAWDIFSIDPGESLKNATGAPLKDPVGVDNGQIRVIRGGGWNSYPGHCRAASRLGHALDRRYDFVGFRLVTVFD